MHRLAGVCGVFCCLAAPAVAKLERPAVEPPKPADVLQYIAKGAEKAAGSALVGGELALSPDAEVLLDGRACEYANVPPTANVLRIEVTPDRRTITRIEFQSAK